MVTTTTCTACQKTFHAFDTDDKQCLSCEETTTMTTTTNPLVEGVKKYARDNYEAGKGWDHVIECFSDEDIAELIGKCRTLNGAIWAVWNKRVRLIWQINLDHKMYREEAEAERRASQRGMVQYWHEDDGVLNAAAINEEHVEARTEWDRQTADYLPTDDYNSYDVMANEGAL